MSGGDRRWKPYPAYKDSGVEWLGQVPEGWEIGRVAFGYDVVLGKMLQPTPKSDNEQQVPYYRAVNVQWESVAGDVNEMWATPEEIEKFSLREGDLLVCEGGEVGRAAIIDFPINEPFIIQNALHRVRALTGFSVKFLLRILEHVASTDWFSVLCNKATIAHFTGEKFKALKFPFPPLAEQHTIATFLDQQCAQIDALIANKHRMLDLLDEKRRAIITQAVTRGLDPSVPMKDSGVEWLGQVPETWEKWKLAHAVDTIGSGTTPKSDNSLYYDEGIPWITTSELRENTITETRSTVSQYALSEYSALRVYPKDTLLVAMYGATIGRMGTLGIEAACNQACCALAGGANISIRFLFFWIQGMKSVLISFASGGGQPNLSQEFIKSIILFIPHAEEQKSIADYLDAQTAALDAQRKSLEKSIDLLREYRASLITQAVTGKIDVRDVVSVQ